MQEKLDIYGRIHSADPTSCAFSAEPRRGLSSLPHRRFTPTYCQLCGTRLNGDTCRECGCVYRSTVDCRICETSIQVKRGPFDASSHGHLYGGCSVAYMCSCGRPNLIPDDFGLSDGCTRCGMRVWYCYAKRRTSTRPCHCADCAEYVENWL